MFGLVNLINGDPDGEALLTRNEASLYDSDEPHFANYKRLQRWNTALIGALGGALLALVLVAAVACLPQAHSTALLVTKSL